MAPAARPLVLDWDNCPPAVLTAGRPPSLHPGNAGCRRRISPELLFIRQTEERAVLA
jgi:hypothetical protein